MDVQSKLRGIGTQLENKTRETQGDDGNLNKSDFLNLFMHQLSHQDPLDPMDSSKMMTQMSQLGSMEQLQNLNAEVKALNQKQTQNGQYAALGLIGHNVSFGKNELLLREGEGAELSFTLPSESPQVTAKVSDAKGALVASVPLGQKTVGVHNFTWDGKNTKGEVLPDGKYTVAFSAYDAQGGKIRIDNTVSHTVQGVKFLEGQPMLKVNGGYRAFGEIQEFNTSAQGLFAGAQPQPSFGKVVEKKL